jgi:hypothetical protein
MEAPLTRLAAPSFGIKTTPADVGYDEIRRVWLEADGIPEIEHAWLYDHLLPRVDPRAGPLGAGDLSGPAYEGWTLLTALAVQTRRLRFGLVVTNNRIRLPAVLAKIAATLRLRRELLPAQGGARRRADHPDTRPCGSGPVGPIVDQVPAVTALS